MSIVSANPVTLAIQRNYDEMREATTAARKSLDHFFNAFHHRKPNQKSFLVKVFFTHRQHVEHVWLDELDFSSTTFSGTQVDRRGTRTALPGHRREFARDRITDWMYVEDGKTVGAYTADILRRQQKAQRLTGLRRIFSLNLVN